MFDCLQGKLKSLADKFEYVMHGLLYKVAEESSKVYVLYPFFYFISSLSLQVVYSNIRSSSDCWI